MTAWNEYSPADFNARRADKRALRRAQEAAETGQAGLFFIATPERKAQVKSSSGSGELAGQEDLFSDDL